MAIETSYSPYGYVPNLAANTVGCVLFGIVLVVQLVLGLATREWWMLVTWGITAGLELTGYICRALSHTNVSSIPLWQVQLLCLIIAPAFMVAGLFLQLSKEIAIFGRQYSPLRPVTYAVLWVSCGVILVVLQAVGGSKAFSESDGSGGTSTGRWLMVAGISFQVLTVACFAVLLGIVTWNVHKEPDPERKWNPDFAENRQRPLFKYWLPALGVSLTFLLIRSISRIVILSEGLSGYLLLTERYFLILDGLMILLGMIPLCVVYPAIAYGNVPVRNFHYRRRAAARLNRLKHSEIDGMPSYSKIDEKEEEDFLA